MHLESLEKPDCRASEREKQQSWKKIVVILIVLLLILVSMLILVLLLISVLLLIGVIMPIMPLHYWLRGEMDIKGVKNLQK